MKQFLNLDPFVSLLLLYIVYQFLFAINILYNLRRSKCFVVVMISHMKNHFFQYFKAVTQSQYNVKVTGSC